VRHSQAHGRTSRRAGLAVLLTFGLLAAGCGNKKDDTGSDSAAQDTSQDTVANEVATTTADASGDTVVDATTTTAAAETPVPGGKLVVSGEAKVANPWTPGKMQCDTYCQERARTFFDPIAALGTDGEVHPYLAESITPNADFTVWTIKLRSGINFTDGTPVNADAAILNLNQAGSGVLLAAALNDVAKNPDKSFMIDKVDDLTIAIHTGKDGDPAKPLKWPTFASALTGQWGLMASPTWLNGIAANPASETAPVGSGPFILDSFSDDKLVVKKNPNYWQKDAQGNQLPYLDEIEFRVIPDSENAQKALETGDIDIFSTSNGAIVADFRTKADQFPMVEQTQHAESNYMLIDLAKKDDPTSDTRVRCALSMAVDRQELIDATGGGIEQPLSTPFTPGQEGYLDDNGLSVEQDIEGAKALIDAYKAEKGVSSVTVQLGHTPTTSNDTVAELLKGYWSQIGVDTNVSIVEQSSFITNALFGVPDFHSYLWRNNAGLTIDNQYYWWHTTNGPPDGELALNFGRINDPVIDENLDKARQEADPAVRKGYAEAINKEFAKECYYMVISGTIWGTPHSPKVHGLGTFVLPDGATAQDGAGFPGQFWTNALWVAQ